jgi:anti-sigma regulatory factor (Ser/Thr protein kinase)
MNGENPPIDEVFDTGQLPDSSGVFEMFFPSSRRGARLARHLAVRRLDAWGIPPGSGDAGTLALLVGELAANAVRHGHVPGRTFHLRLTASPPPAERRRPDTVRVEVSDTRGERGPVLGEVCTEAVAEGLQECGRGLLLVDALAAKWGVADRGIGKTVWCEYVLTARR